MRLVRHGAETRLEGFLLAGDTRAEAWIKTLLQDELPAQAYGRLLLAPGATAADADAAARPADLHLLRTSPKRRIGEHLAALRGQRARSASPRCRRSLKCGTNCGSCVPELQRLVRVGHWPHRARLPQTSTGDARSSVAANQPPRVMSHRGQSGHGHQPVHQGNRPRQARRALAQPRAGGRPVRPGARRRGDRPGGRRLLPGHAHQGRNARRRWRVSWTPRTRACTACRRATRPLVVLPSYNGARKLPVLTPLLALLLARRGLPVLIHGTATESARVSVEPICCRRWASRRWPRSARSQPGEAAFVADRTAVPGLEAPAGCAPRHRAAQFRPQPGQADEPLRRAGGDRQQLHPPGIRRFDGRGVRADGFDRAAAARHRRRSGGRRAAAAADGRVRRADAA